jgi:hypothetical protein
MPLANGEILKAITIQIDDIGNLVNGRAYHRWATRFPVLGMSRMVPLGVA